MYEIKYFIKFTAWATTKTDMEDINQNIFDVEGTGDESYA